MREQQKPRATAPAVVYIDSPEEIADNHIAWHEGAGSVLDDVIYQFINQDLWERFNRDDMHKLKSIHACLESLVSNRLYQTPTELRDQFNRWFANERNTGNTPAASLDPIPNDHFTVNHITSRTIIQPNQERVIQALLWWLHTEHPDTYDEHAPTTPDDFSTN